MKRIPKEVKAGMALLDEKVPGWREKIDPETLNMKWCGYCVLGQLFGNYYTGLTELGILEYEHQDFDNEAEEQARNLGFHAKSGVWDTLTKTWKEALTETSSPIAAD